VLGTTLDAGTKVQSSSRVGQLGTRSQLRLVGTHILLWRLSALSSYIYIRIHTCIWPCLVMLNGDHTCNLMEPVRVWFFRAIFSSSRQCSPLGRLIMATLYCAAKKQKSLPVLMLLTKDWNWTPHSCTPTWIPQSCTPTIDMSSLR
jgi:hypothetical protein